MIPEQVRVLKKAIEKNWEKSGGDISDNPVYVQRLDENVWQLSDNYERYFPFIYTYRNGNWFVRKMYTEEQDNPYSFESAMSDASIMYTG